MNPPPTEEPSRFMLRIPADTLIRILKFVPHNNSAKPRSNTVNLPQPILLFIVHQQHLHLFESIN